MDNDIVIDNKTYKMMKYLYRKNEAKISTLQKKFKDDARSLPYLCDYKYALYRKPDGTLTFESSSIHHDGTLGLTPLGNKYVENKRETFIQWFVPILISCLSAVISLMAIAISIFSNSHEIFVHIVK